MERRSYFHRREYRRCNTGGHNNLYCYREHRGLYRHCRFNRYCYAVTNSYCEFNYDLRWLNSYHDRKRRIELFVVGRRNSCRRFHS